MPFSFKPDISQGGEQQPVAPMAPAGTPTPVPTIASREVAADSSLVDLLIRIAFGLAFCIVVGLVGYKYYLSEKIDFKKSQIQSYDAQLAGLPVEDMRKLSNRIKLVNQLVKEHPSISSAFEILEASVENQITYSGFDLRYNDTAKNYQLQLRGYAPNYKSIAQQVDTYKRKPYSAYVSNLVVEGLVPNEKGLISFVFKMPVAIAGVLPETIQLADGPTPSSASTTPTTASTTQSLVASTTPSTASTTPGKATASTTPVTGSTTPKR